MAYYKKVLQETVSAINRVRERNFHEVCVRRIRKCNAIPSSERSKINFISRALKDLSKLGYLQYVGRHSPKIYKIVGKIDFNEIKEKMNLR